MSDVLGVGISAVRRAIFDGRLEEEIGCVAASGWDATGVATGRSTEEALERARAAQAVEALTTPLVVVKLGPLPKKVPGAFWEAGFRRWVRALGDDGVVGHALVREDRNGQTYVGESVLDVVNPWKLDAEIEASERAARALLRGLPLDDRPSVESASFTTYRVFDNARRAPMPAERVGGVSGLSVDVATLLNDDLVWLVARHRTLA